MNDDFAKLTGPARLEITRMLPAGCERVWQYLTDPELRQQWFCAGETGNSPGGAFVMDFDHSRLSSQPPTDGPECGDPVIVRGTLISYDPPYRLSYRWPGMEDGEDDSIVSIELTKVGDQTRLHLVHTQLENPDFQKGASAGWHAHLDLLSDLAAGKPARDFWQHYGQLKTQYDAIHEQDQASKIG